MTATVSPMVTTDPAHAKLQTFAPPQEVAPDVLMHAAFVNTYALRTPAGLLLVDPGLTMTSQTVYSAVRAWSEATLHTNYCCSSSSSSAVELPSVLCSFSSIDSHRSRREQHI